MFVLGRTPQHVASRKLEDRTTLQLRPTHSLGDDQCLTKRVRMPRRSRARFEVDNRSAHAGRLGPLELTRYGHLPCEILGRAVDRLQVGFARNIHCRTPERGCGWAGSNAPKN